LVEVTRVAGKALQRKKENEDVSRKDFFLLRPAFQYIVVFEGKERATVRVSGDGSSDLDCFVYDGGGNLVEKDSGPLDECSLVWVPAWTGKFTIKIRNLGDAPNEYRIWTN